MSDPRDSPIGFSATAFDTNPRKTRTLLVPTAATIVANAAVAVPAYIWNFPTVAPTRIDLSGLPISLVSLFLAVAVFGFCLASTITGPAAVRVVGAIGLLSLVAQVAAVDYGFTHLP